MRLELEVAAGLCPEQHLLGRPLLPGLRITCHLRRSEAVELQVIGWMDRDQLPLQMGGEFG